MRNGVLGQLCSTLRRGAALEHFVHLELESLHSPTPNWEQLPRNVTHYSPVVS